MIAQSGRAWFEKAGTADADAFTLNGYGCAAKTGGEALLRALVQDIRRKIAPVEGLRLLEVGCGSGAMTSRLAAGTIHPVAIDFSHSMLVHARRTTSHAFAAGDASRLPFPSRSFDRVVCYSVFNNFPSLLFAETVVDELIRVVRPGGNVLIGQVPNAARSDAWQRAYAAKFGQAPPSRLRARAGAVKNRGLQIMRATLSLAGKRPPARLHFQYYTAEFFARLAAQRSVKCELLPAYNLLAEENSPDVLADYRLDVKLTC